MIIPLSLLLAASVTDQPATQAPRPPQSHGSAASLFSRDDYPAQARGTGAHGKVVARLTVDASGRVIKCDIRQSSGSAVLDEATCNILRRRSRYGPGLDQRGQPLVGTVDEEIDWKGE